MFTKVTMTLAEYANGFAGSSLGRHQWISALDWGDEMTNGIPRILPHVVVRIHGLRSCTKFLS